MEDIAILYTGQEETYSAKASFGSKSEGSYGHAGQHSREMLRSWDEWAL